MTTSPYSQRVITVTPKIDQRANPPIASATYEYYNQEGIKLVSTSCDMTCEEETNYLFLLDQSSLNAGWTITGYIPNDPDNALTSYPGPFGQCWGLTDSYARKNCTYAFSLQYTINNVNYPIDPQTRNEPGDGTP